MKSLYISLFTMLLMTVLSCSKQEQPTYVELATKSTRIVTASYSGGGFTDLDTYFYVITENAFDTGHVPVVVWYFGDGTMVRGNKGEYHKYAQPGDYKVMVRADNDTAYIEIHVTTWPSSAYTALAARSSQIWKITSASGHISEFPSLTSLTQKDTTFEANVPVVVENDAAVSMVFSVKWLFRLTTVDTIGSILIFEEFPYRERKLMFNYLTGYMEYSVSWQRGKEYEYLRMHTL